MVYWNRHGMTHMRLWLSMMIQNVRTKQAEEKWSLRQYNFLADKRKTVSTRLSFGRLDINSKANSRWISLVVKTTVWLFSSKTDTSNSFFPYRLLIPKDCIFRHHLCPKWKRYVLTSQTVHIAANDGFEVSMNNCWANVHTKVCSLWYCISDYIIQELLRFIGQ